MKKSDLGVEIVQLGGGPLCTKRLGDPLEYDFGYVWGSICTLYIVWGGDPPPAQEVGDTIIVSFRPVVYP